MFYYHESSFKNKMLNQEVYQKLLNTSFTLLQVYFLHMFKIRDKQYRALFIRMFISQLNAYETISDLQIHCIDEMDEHRTSTYIIGKEKDKVESFSDFCGLLIYLRKNEIRLIQLLESLMKKEPSLQECFTYHQQCLYTIEYLLKELTDEDGCKEFDELEGNYFDPLVPYFKNHAKK